MQVHDFNIRFLNHEIALLEQYIEQIREERASDSKISFMYSKPRLN